ncbi:hypothetical protein HY522_07485 [bacterium]|nr:hypothetical protein [bacterium]
MTEVGTIETEIAPMAGRYGLAVYDIEFVSLGRPLLRVFVEKCPSTGEAQPERAGVSIGEIDAFAKVLIPFLTLQGLFPREGRVEVSSPGIFRRLRRKDHFESAVGQPVEVTARTGGVKQTVRAKLLAVSDDGITLESDALPFLPFSDILRAKLQTEVAI